jgi:U3 small nucleolar RNA-associated protein 5
MPVNSPNMTPQNIIKFSSDCSKLAMTTPDGRLTVWGNGGGGGSCQLLHQFSPSTHLSAVSTCLAWATPTTKKKKKTKSMDQQSDLVAMGTSAGTVLLYSTMQGGLVTTFKTENSTKINCLVWTKSASSIFAAGEVMM